MPGRFTPRKPNPFGHGETPFDPFTGRYLPLDPYANPSFKHAYFVSEDADCMVCSELSSEEREADPLSSGGLFFVAKPFFLRKTPFNGETVNEVNYSYVLGSPNSRVASKEDENDEFQIITPDYYEDEIILMVWRNTGLDDENNLLIKWEDINAAGRSWGVDF